MTVQPDAIFWFRRAARFSGATTAASRLGSSVRRLSGRDLSGPMVTASCSTGCPARTRFAVRVRRWWRRSILGATGWGWNWTPNTRQRQPGACGWWRTRAMRRMPSVSVSGTWEIDRPFPRNGAMRRLPAPNGPIGVDILSKTSGLASRSGVQSQPDTKKQQRRSSRSYTSLPLQTGSSPNRP